MDDNPEFSLKQICCTCLSVSRRLIQLCKVKDGVNELYLLLSSNPEAYEELFFRDSASLSMCWECRARMQRVSGFRRQASLAQKQLTAVVNGWTDVKSFSCLSHLSVNHKSSFDKTLVSEYQDILSSDVFEDRTNHQASQQITSVNDYFVSCDTGGVDIKSELDDEDIPLAELNIDDFSGNYNILPRDTSRKKGAGNKRKNTKRKLSATGKERKLSTKNKLEKQKGKSNGKKDLKCKDAEYYKIKVMSEKEMSESRVYRALAVNFIDSKTKCDSCIEIFTEQTDLDSHNRVLHTEKPNHTQCDICQCYVTSSSHMEHRTMHYNQYLCQFCEYVAYCFNGIVKHLKVGHSIKNLTASVKWKKGLRKTPKVRNPGSKPRMNPVMRDKRTPFGYQCTDCPKYFETKRQRWMHVMRDHRDGFRCSFCGKRFAFKYNLIKHERLHAQPIPREQCAVCHKRIRIDLLRAHAATHGGRDTHACAPCGRSFASRASYRHHLKYTRAHAALQTILKYKCSECDKGYRSKAELRDHENYQHRGETQHKCPICNKALATVRCVRRHVKRAHEGIKENQKDKVCQQCGKTFRDKKTLREHELTHTGERPLTCTECGNTFRQYASLYTHRKRVHKIHAARRQIKTASG